MYTPNPLDTSQIKIPEELCELSEKIAENVHEVWAQRRMAEGWSYSDVRDDAKKQTPCMVPYSQLPESEKAYDRNTALETLKTVISLGYEIRKKD